MPLTASACPRRGMSSCPTPWEAPLPSQALRLTSGKSSISTTSLAAAARHSSLRLLPTSGCKCVDAQTFRDRRELTPQGSAGRQRGISERRGDISASRCHLLASETAKVCSDPSQAIACTDNEKACGGSQLVRRFPASCRARRISPLLPQGSPALHGAHRSCERGAKCPLSLLASRPGSISGHPSPLGGNPPHLSSCGGQI
ncbi:uncharacterized protein LY79DRAFT_100358 [Colletotrichum navitas]|uniref:Uncharacterized protein n=1 Tax=Colletotrichum navitas TaxID=681940 RepID=A0AAD8V5Z0_9PEZI|nr:uncharacterized protein LY79DRAFT_100358 [Colletotrichum navitas]KAK1595502.1 hypothetical protein LY79DRAFT_100358 [Colletotrichum navitas]